MLNKIGLAVDLVDYQALQTLTARKRKGRKQRSGPTHEHSALEKNMWASVLGKYKERGCRYYVCNRRVFVKGTCFLICQPKKLQAMKLLLPH